MAIGILLAAVLPSAITTHAAPQGADEAARGTRKSGTEVTRLVTGDPARINAAVAGVPWLPTTIFAITPVAAKVGSYPPGTSIVGSELRAEVGGFRAWFEIHVSNWDPNQDGIPHMCYYQISIDGSGYLGLNAIPSNPGVDLAPANVDCTIDAECVAAFGESWTTCESAECKAGYLDRMGTGRPDSWCMGECEFGGVNTSTHNFNYFSVINPPIGRLDGGIVYYGGTLVLDIPLQARGTYIVNLNHDETFWGPVCSTVGTPLDAAADVGFSVIIESGQCCFGLGTPDEGCIDGVLRSECGNKEPSPFIFTPDGQCPPGGPECPHLGACCDTLHAQCEDEVLEADCSGPRRSWRSQTLCDEADCQADTGACCNHDPFGPCTDDTVLYDCRCATCTWHKLQACAEIECAPTPIPTVSEWGLTILTLLLLTGAKILFARRIDHGSEHRAQAR